MACRVACAGSKRGKRGSVLKLIIWNQYGTIYLTGSKFPYARLTIPAQTVSTDCTEGLFIRATSWTI